MNFYKAVVNPLLIGKDNMHNLEEKILPFRIQIDAIDKEILSLLNKRAKLAQEIGHIKNEFKAPVFKPEREKMIVKSLEQENAGPLTHISIQSIWREIMSACRSLEEENRVAFLGPAGTFSEQAMFTYFGLQTHGFACTNIDEVFRAIETKQTKFAILPIENSTEGAVSRTLDLLFNTSCYIIGEVIIDINHQLLSKISQPKEAMTKAKVIVAHPQALAQCQIFLNSNPELKNLERRAVESNAYAAELSMHDETILAIAGEQAANEYGLFKIKQHIQDEINNRTRFIILGNDKTNSTGLDQTSIMFAIKNEVGAIVKAVAPFSKYEVSMSRLQSRPAKQTGNTREWEYHFLVDIDGHINDEKVAKALEEVKQNTKFFKWLGSYTKFND
jgi:chorismate mutase/prephenate dehydratase